MRGLIPSLVRYAPQYRRAVRPTFQYWLETEVHVYGFSIAASVLLSFWPFLLLMVSLCRYGLGWPTAEESIYLALKDYFPGSTGEFLAYNLQARAWEFRAISWLSVALLLFTANGIFLPLEVALNRAWGVTKNRTFWKNQLVSYGMVVVCGILALISIVLPAWGLNVLRQWFGTNLAVDWGARAFFKVVSIPVTILMVFLVYWKLPNRKVPVRLILPGAILVGLALELLKWIALVINPWLQAKLKREYEPFNNSATVLLWSFFAGMLFLAGADWASRRARAIELAQRKSG